MLRVGYPPPHHPLISKESVGPVGTGKAIGELDGWKPTEGHFDVPTGEPVSGDDTTARRAARVVGVPKAPPPNLADSGKPMFLRNAATSFSSE
jgi:hypothetical protein